MNYKVLFSDKATKEIKKFDKKNAAIILAWIRKNLENCDNPRLRGKGLTANRSGQWRYRIGNYPIIADISDKNVTVLVITVAHQSDAYTD